MLYRRQPRVNTTQFCGDWWEVISTESEADGDGSEVVALAETETMALHIQLIPGMVETLRLILHERDYFAKHGRYDSIEAECLDDWAADKASKILKNLKVLE